MFDLCVWSLELMSDLTGLTYKDVNVLVFCLTWPALTLWLAYLAFLKRR